MVQKSAEKCNFKDIIKCSQQACVGITPSSKGQTGNTWPGCHSLSCSIGFCSSGIHRIPSHCTGQSSDFACS